MNVPVKVIATRIDKNRGNVCTSRRAVLEKSKNAEVKEALKNIKEGDIIENARVKACTDWGIFLDINGLDALCHVSDISYGRVKKPSDLVTIGQKLKVRITKIDPVTNRVSASVKALTDDPYEDIEKKYKVGEIYDGVCTKLMQYGVFVRLQEGVEGLIHNSELSWTNKNIEPSKVLSSSQTIKVKIVSIDKDAKRISLSYRETLENPWKDIQDKVGSVVSAKIKNITDKAIFAEMESGLIGMIHYREISFNENIDDLKKYKKNSLIKAKIIEAKDEKIRLSIRALGKDPMSWFEENKKKVGSIISTKVVEVLKTGVKVAIDPEKKIVVTIKKNQLAVEPSDCRPEIYSPGNTMADAKIQELDIKNRKIVLSPKAAAIDEEKSLVAKFGEGAAKSGATLKGIFEKALSGAKGKKKEKKE
jgi:small subunit ribosomal protein S1